MDGWMGKTFLDLRNSTALAGASEANRIATLAAGSGIRRLLAFIQLWMAANSSQWLPCCAHLFSAEWWADWSAEPSVDHETLLEPEGPVGQQPSGNELKLKAFGVGRVLGTGAFSTVRLGTHRASGRTYALKLVDKQKSNAKSIAHEVGLMRRGGAHAHLVSLFDHFELARAWVLVLELVSGGEVFDRICSRGAYSERDAAARQPS